MASSPASEYDFALRPRADVSLERIGHEQEPVLIIEGLVQDPAQLIEYAAREVSFEPVWGPQGGYPGVRAPAPLNFVGAAVRALSPMVERAFGLASVKLARAQCSFSLVTLPPERLAPLQRIPHIDTTDPLQFAILLYLCEPRFGGTAFYRHRATGFEALTPERKPVYEEVRERELSEGADDRYIAGDTPHYVQTAAFEAAMGRLLVYRSRILHSGQIDPETPLSDDPRRGRLTANIFVNYRRS
ncbi:MAG TPA: DUF6445 family protein [Allosphingosinicella sp.]|jgi:hypothetical protein|nr:DUF6445 family protein [Allosphingosinicella sp.]